MDFGSGTNPRFPPLNSKIKIYDSTATAGWETYEPLVNASYVNPGTSWGIEAEFLYQYALANPNVNVWVVKVAQGGTNLAVNWLPPSGTWWTNLVADYEAAQAALVTAGINIDASAFMWMQGEADAGNSDHAAAYDENLETLFDAVRTLCGAGTKIVVGRISSALYPDYSQTNIVRAAQVTVTRADGNAVILSTDPITMTTIPHYDLASQDELGLYFYQGFAGLYDDKPTNLAITWATGFEDGIIPESTSPGTTIGTVSADPGVYVGGSGMTYSDASDTSGKVNISGTSLLLGDTVVDGVDYACSFRAFNSIMGYEDYAFTLYGAEAVADPLVWDSASKGAGVVLTNSDTTAEGPGGAWRAVRSSIGKSTGKWYVEMKMTAVADGTYMLGVADDTTSPLSGQLGAIANSACVYMNGGTYETGFTQVSADISLGSNTVDHVYGIAFDADAKKVWIAKQNTWLQSGNPAAGSNEWASWTGTRNIFAAFGTNSAGNKCTIQQTNTYSPPSGFTALFF